MANVVVDSPGLINFQLLIARGGTVEGARTLFEHLVNDIVALEHPEVRSIAASPGDWGIDAFIGDMDGGNVGVWQAKYYLDKVETKHKAEIISSYTTARDKAEENRYTLTSWTLCVPSELVPTMAKWWSSWKKTTEESDHVAIELWDQGQLRRRLLRPGDDVRGVREHYFNPVVTVPGTGEPPAEPRPWREIADVGRYDEFLFVHQLARANFTETRAAREAFFNADLLEGEIADKAVPRETNALRTWRARVDATWESKYNHIASTTDESNPQLPGLYQAVMDHIDHHHGEHAKSLRAQVMHGQGLMHQQVEAAQAGWVRNWRKVAEDHAAATMNKDTTIGSNASRTTPRRRNSATSATSPDHAAATATAAPGAGAGDEAGAS